MPRPVSSRHLARAWALVAGLMGLGGCGSQAFQGSEDIGATSTAGTAPGFIRLNARADDEFFPQAQITGRLVKQDGCLLVGDVVAVWTADFSFSADTETLEWPGDSARLGDYVEFGGGVQPAGSENNDSLLSEANAEAVADCTAALGARWTYVTP